MTTSPWRSTKWAGPISNWLGRYRNRVHHTNPAAKGHTTSCSEPPMAPLIATSTAGTRLYGAKPRIAAALRSEGACTKRNEWMATTTSHARPKARPSPAKAVGTASAITR